MKKVILISFCVMAAFILQSQTIFTEDNFNASIFSYQIQKYDGVSQKEFERGSFILKEARNAVAEHDMEFNCADYWNIAMAFMKLGEPKVNIEIAFRKGIEDNAESICAYIESFGEQSVKKIQSHLPELFAEFYPTCWLYKSEEYKKQHPEIWEGNALATLMKAIGESDQLYRKFDGTDWSKQTPIDQRNLRLIDSLYAVHQMYIGEDLVGKEMSHIMWLIIQHSNLEKMEFYLPVIHEAVQNSQLATTPLKMLLDRIHCIKYDYQFFGSQFGGDEECVEKKGKEKEAILKKYNLF